MAQKNTTTCFSGKEVIEQINQSYKDKVESCLSDLTDDQKSWAESQMSIFYLKGNEIPFDDIRQFALNLRIDTSKTR